MVVVASACADETYARLTALLALRRHSARIVDDPIGGVSRARNLALAHAEAPIVCFFDDDELVDPNWIESLRTAWLHAQADVAVIGGPIRPRWETRRPSWLRDDILYVLSLLDLGPAAQQLDQSPHIGYIWGGNMSVRRQAALEVGGFDELRGVRPSAPLGRGEEEHIQRRMAARSWQIWYEPSAIVHHQLPATRTTLQYFRRAISRGRAWSGPASCVSAAREYPARCVALAVHSCNRAGQARRRGTGEPSRRVCMDAADVAASSPPDTATPFRRLRTSLPIGPAPLSAAGRTMPKTVARGGTACGGRSRDDNAGAAKLFCGSAASARLPDTRSA